MTVSPCQVFSDAVLVVSVAAALEIDVAVVSSQVLPPPRHVVGDEHENHVVVLRSKVLECVLRLHPHSRCTILFDEISLQYLEISSVEGPQFQPLPSEFKVVCPPVVHTHKSHV